MCLTSIQVGVRFAGTQKHGLSRLEDDVVQEVDREAPNITGILWVEAEQQDAVAARHVLPSRTCKWNNKK